MLLWLVNIGFAGSGAAEPVAPTFTGYYTVYSRVPPIDLISTARAINKDQTTVPIIGATSK